MPTNINSPRANARGIFLSGPTIQDGVIQSLKRALAFSVVKKTSKDGVGRTASLANSLNGGSYLSAYIASDTNLLDISSELAALVLASQKNDFGISEVITMVENPNPQQVGSPLVIKILIDFQIRTGTKIRYSIVDERGKVLFDAKDLRELMPFYSPVGEELAQVRKGQVSDNRVPVGGQENTALLLKKYAILGLERNFPTYNSASGYGAAIITDKNNLYFGGQYSSFDKRIGLHAEMAVAVNVLSRKNKEKITHLGLVSTKYKDEPCQLCGCCRQFFAELIEREKMEIDFFCFAKENDVFSKYTIEKILPGRWSSKNW